MRNSDISPLSRVIRRIDAAQDGDGATEGVATGFPSIDRWLGGGLRAGDLIVLGGEVGSGKSALALAMALRMAEAGHTVQFRTGEMTVERVMERVLAIEGRTRVDDLRQGALDEVTRAGVGAAAVRYRESLPEIMTLGLAGISELQEGIVRNRPQVLIVDPLQWLAMAMGGDDAALATAVTALKGLALEHGIAVITTSGLPSGLHERADPRPTLSDFGARGAIQQHADVILGLYREEMYAPGSGVEGATELLIRKNRNGATGYVDLYYYKQWLRFEDLLEPDR